MDEKKLKWVDEQTMKRADGQSDELTDINTGGQSLGRTNHKTGGKSAGRRHNENKRERERKKKKRRTIRWTDRQCGGRTDTRLRRQKGQTTPHIQAPSETLPPSPSLAPPTGQRPTPGWGVKHETTLTKKRYSHSSVLARHCRGEVSRRKPRPTARKTRRQRRQAVHQMLTNCMVRCSKFQNTPSKVCTAVFFFFSTSTCNT